jgi:hypothetical protein
MQKVAISIVSLILIMVIGAIMRRVYLYWLMVGYLTTANIINSTLTCAFIVVFFGDNEHDTKPIGYNAETKDYMKRTAIYISTLLDEKYWKRMLNMKRLLDLNKCGFEDSYIVRNSIEDMKCDAMTIIIMTDLIKFNKERSRSL